MKLISIACGYGYRHGSVRVGCWSWVGMARRIKAKAKGCKRRESRPTFTYNCQTNIDLHVHNWRVCKIVSNGVHSRLLCLLFFSIIGTDIVYL